MDATAGIEGTIISLDVQPRSPEGLLAEALAADPATCTAAATVLPVGGVTHRHPFYAMRPDWPATVVQWLAGQSRAPTFTVWSTASVAEVDGPGLVALLADEVARPGLPRSVGVVVAGPDGPVLLWFGRGRATICVRSGAGAEGAEVFRAGIVGLVGSLPSVAYATVVVGPGPTPDVFRPRLGPEVTQHLRALAAVTHGGCLLAPHWSHVVRRDSWIGKRLADVATPVGSELALIEVGSASTWWPDADDPGLLDQVADLQPYTWLGRAWWDSAVAGGWSRRTGRVAAMWAVGDLLQVLTEQGVASFDRLTGEDAGRAPVGDSDPGGHALAAEVGGFTVQNEPFGTIIRHGTADWRLWSVEVLDDDDEYVGPVTTAGTWAYWATTDGRLVAVDLGRPVDDVQATLWDLGAMGPSIG